MMQSFFLFNIESKILSETKNTTKTHDTRVYNENTDHAIFHDDTAWT